MLAGSVRRRRAPLSDCAIISRRLGVVAREQPIDESPLTGVTFELDVDARGAVRVANGEGITALAGARRSK